MVSNLCSKIVNNVIVDEFGGQFVLFLSSKKKKAFVFHSDGAVKPKQFLSEFPTNHENQTVQINVPAFTPIP